MDKLEVNDRRLLGRKLHKRLLDGDVTVSAEIAEVFLFQVIQKLQLLYPNLNDPHLVDTAVENAFLSYFDNPQQYDPNRSPLGNYLAMSARGDLLNLLRANKYRGFPRDTEFVELDESTREYKIEIKDEALSVEEQTIILASPVWALLEKLLPDMTDRELALLMLEGVRETDEYAHALGISNLSKMQQETEVKRHKDRIKKSLRRHIDRSELDLTQ